MHKKKIIKINNKTHIELHFIFIDIVRRCVELF